MSHRTIDLLRGMTVGLWVMLPLVGLSNAPYWFQVPYGIVALLFLLLSALSYQYAPQDNFTISHHRTSNPHQHREG